jgi:Uncharacterized protein conserved in bacteria
MRLDDGILLEKAFQRLKENIVPNKITVIKTAQNETIARIESIDFICMVKSNITNANINSVVQQLLEFKKNFEQPVLLVVKFIYPELMNEFANYDISILDSAGNCIIRKGSLFLFVKGQKNVLIKGVTDRLQKESGIKLIFHFLMNHESVNLPYRKIQEKTNLSLGTIKNVMEELITNNFILKTDKGRFLKNKKKLLERWVMAYNQTLKPKLLLDQMTFRNNEKRDKWLTMELPEGMYWGGESGANLIDGYLYPGLFDIYSEVQAKTILTTGFVIPKKDGEIKIYQKFWLDKQENKIVSPLLIYADLMGSGNSRCLEMAQKIYDHELSNFE